jgi:hypothetical protein
VITALLSGIGERARAANVRAPAVLIVGETAALAHELAWFEGRDPQADPFHDLGPEAARGPLEPAIAGDR